MASIRSGIGEFQSTLPREERLFHNCFEHVFNYFNPRSHERSDTMPTPIKLSRSHISIHAPTRGATSSVVCLNSSMRNFNPRSHERSDHKALKLIVSFYQFQSTLPREERRLWRWLCKHKRYFNPRSHERSDALASYFGTRTDISIHAPTRGATDYRRFNMSIKKNFNPRSHERSDGNCYTLTSNSGISIHAPTRGATPLPEELGRAT